MKDLVIRSQQGRDVTTSLIVAEVFGKRHDNVLRDIENLSCSDSFRLLNFEETPYTNLQNGQTYKMYEMTKDGFSFLVMGYTGEKAGQFKEDFINEFNRREMMLKSDDYILARSQEILHNRLQMAEKQLEAQRAELEAAAPKVAASNAMLASKNSCLVGELAKIISQNGYTIGQNRLFQWLRENGYLGKCGEYYNIPNQRHVEQGLFEVKRSTRSGSSGELYNITTTKVTPKGQEYFIRKFTQNGDL
ncbi:Rha family transcriptional regulator [Porphyromonas endodontalis]